MANNDTTTTLNPGTGGDLMNESLITQSSGAATKSARVVKTGEDGSIQTIGGLGTGFVAGVRTPAHVEDAANGVVLQQMLIEMQRIRVILHEYLNSTTARGLSIEDMDEIAGRWASSV